MCEIEGNMVILSFRSRGWDCAEWKSIEQRVPIVWTRCHLGGGRPWFRCNASVAGTHCGRLVAKLYLGASAGFACRHCYGLVYASQLEPPSYRGLGMARKIRNRLGGGPDLFDPFPERPKGMHLRTYQELRRRYDLAVIRCGFRRV